ncbi:MAG TPA: hypothetical protein VFD27_09100 [Chthoniobacteraceae bacterium]|jgi:hypothetical protein|nr:hypothetical protein [Chthoniobacteraceae bacterium]
MKTPALLALALASFTLPHTLLAQGSDTPPGPPGPTMKSLQELWDELQTLKAKSASRQQQITTLQKGSAAFGLLLENASIVLPWQISTVDSTGTVGLYTSLAFTPGGSRRSATTTTRTTT